MIRSWAMTKLRSMRGLEEGQGAVEKPENEHYKKFN
jgi:hypothetical protein